MQARSSITITAAAPSWEPASATELKSRGVSSWSGVITVVDEPPGMIALIERPPRGAPAEVLGREPGRRPGPRAVVAGPREVAGGGDTDRAGGGLGAEGGGPPAPVAD